MTESDQSIKKYELMLIFSGDLALADFEKELAEMRKMLQESTAGISYEDSWGKRDLSYKIKKQLRGYYVVFNLMAAAAAFSELHTAIKLNPVILRHVLIALPEGYAPDRYKEPLILYERKPAEIEKKQEMKIPVETAIDASLQISPGISVETSGKTVSKELVLTSAAEKKENLENVEKKLQQILENPDIEIT